MLLILGSATPAKSQKHESLTRGGLSGESDYRFCGAFLLGQLGLGNITVAHRAAKAPMQLQVLPTKYRSVLDSPASACGGGAEGGIVGVSVVEAPVDSISS